MSRFLLRLLLNSEKLWFGFENVEFKIGNVKYV